MSFGHPDKTSKRRPAPGGGKFFFMLLLVFGVMMIMRNVNNNQANQGLDPEQGTTAPWQDENPLEPIESTQTDSRGPERHPDSSDWSMEEIPAKQNAKAGRPSEPQNKSTQSGDWKLEEVPTSDKKKGDNDFGLNLSNKKSPENPKSTKKGDWELEEVPGKKKDN